MGGLSLRAPFPIHPGEILLIELLKPHDVIDFGVARTDELDVDTRTDISWLGVVRYELLTGRTRLERDSIGREGCCLEYSSRYAKSSRRVRVTRWTFPVRFGVSSKCMGSMTSQISYHAGGRDSTT